MDLKLLCAAALVTAAAAMTWPVGARARDHRDQSNGDRARAHGPNGTPRPLAYASAPVAHAGRIAGTVRWTGSPLALAPLPVPPAIVQANPSCGVSTPNPAL